ncbi:hypothetical protein HY570_00740 [Candidatus Micrarchaeota archaeon]|nr:hypothetical protein [Candidatus Micrarchaeota archaeon]
MLEELRKERMEVKAAAVAIVMVALFIVTSFFVQSLFTYSSSAGFGMHAIQTNEVNFLAVNVVSLLIAIACGLLAFRFLNVRSKETLAKPEQRDYSEVFEAMKKGLSSDERMLVEEVQKSGEITQDSLRLRLGWSKSKLSTIASYLDRQGIVQRKRSGKTYVLFLDKSVVSKKE